MSLRKLNLRHTTAIFALDEHGHATQKVPILSN